jgi:hypothetical protein
MRDRLAALLLFAAAFCGDNPFTAAVLLVAGAAVQILSGRDGDAR